MSMLSFVEVAHARTTEYMDASDISRKWLDVPYGSGPRHRLDIYLPEEGEGPFPAVIQITGGGWVYGDKSMKKMSDMIHTVVGRGYALVSINYTLSDDAKYPTQILECKAAVRFIRQHAAQYRIDPEHIFLYGNSAGGYLSLMTAFTREGDWIYDVPREDQQGISSRVTAVADIYGVTHFEHAQQELAVFGLDGKYERDTLRSCEGYFFGYDLREKPQEVARASVFNYVRPDVPPVLVQHGTHDRTVCVKQSYDLVHLLNIAGVYNEHDWFDGLDHSDPYFKSEKNTNRVLDFFDRFLK